MQAPGAYPNYPQAQGFPGQQGRTLLQSNTLSIVAGQNIGDPNRYVVKEQNGQPLLWGVDFNGAISLKDCGQMETLRLYRTTQTQVNLHDAAGNPIGSVLISAKTPKEHKKDKYKDGNGKKQIILQNSMNQALLVMSGKSKHSGGNVEMKIKSQVTHSSSSSYTGDKKYKDKDHHKDKKEKDHKDKKDKKKGQVGEVTGNANTGFQLHITNSQLSLPERINVVGLLIAYMELQKPGTVSSGAHHPGQPTQPYAMNPGTAQPTQPYTMNPGAAQHGVYQSQVFPIPGQQPIQMPMGQGYPGVMPQAHMGQMIPGTAPPSNQMGFVGGSPAGFAGAGSPQPPFPGQYHPH